MARTNTTGGSNMAAGTAIVNAYPFTVGCWFNTNALPLGSNQNIFCIGGATKDNIGLYIDQSTSKFGFYVSNSAGSFDTNPIGSALSNNTWHSGMMVGASATSRTGYIDGAGTTTTTNFSLGTSQTNTWLFSFEAGADNSGLIIAEVTVWNVALSAGEATAFATGVLPRRIRPNAIVGYWPLFGLVLPEPDLSGNGHAFAQSAGTVSAANHSPTTLWTSRSISTPLIPVTPNVFTPYDPWPLWAPVLAQ